MKRYYFFLNLSVYLFFISLFIIAATGDKTASFISLTIISGALILVLPFFAIFIFLKKTLKEKDLRNKRVEKYGKYLRAAGLPEDIRDVLGHYIYFQTKNDNGQIIEFENGYYVSGYSYSEINHFLRLRFNCGNEEYLIICSNNNVEIYIKSNKNNTEGKFVRNSIKIL